MPQDYAKSATNSWSKKSFMSQHKNWIILVSMIVIAFVFIRYSSMDFNQIQQKVAHTIEKNQTRPVELPKPKFEFYTRLPKGNVSDYKAKANKAPIPPELTSKRTEQTAVKPPPATPIKNTAQHYLIQVAAFKQQTDADKLRAELIMQGFNATLSHYKTNATTWYRVEIGPFPSLPLAKEQQLSLEKVHFNGLIKKVSA